MWWNSFRFWHAQNLHFSPTIVFYEWKSPLRRPHHKPRRKRQIAHPNRTLWEWTSQKIVRDRPGTTAHTVIERSSLNCQEGNISRIHHAKRHTKTTWHAKRAPYPISAFTRTEYHRRSYSNECRSIKSSIVCTFDANAILKNKLFNFENIFTMYEEILPHTIQIACQNWSNQFSSDQYVTRTQHGRFGNLNQIKMTLLPCICARGARGPPTYQSL